MDGSHVLFRLTESEPVGSVGLEGTEETQHRHCIEDTYAMLIVIYVDISPVSDWLE